MKSEIELLEQKYHELYKMIVRIMENINKSLEQSNDSLRVIGSKFIEFDERISKLERNSLN